MAAKLLSFYLLVVAGLGVVQAAPLDKRQDEGALSVATPLVTGVAEPVFRTLGPDLVNLNLTLPVFNREAPLDKRQDEGALKAAAPGLGQKLIKQAVQIVKDVFIREEPVILDKRNGTLANIGEAIVSSFDHPIETLGKFGSEFLTGALGVASAIEE